MEDAKPDWCSLPKHLLAVIAKRLQTRIDTLRFRAICKTFRSSVPPLPKISSPYPDLEYFQPSSTEHPKARLYRMHLEFIESTVYAMEPRSEISKEIGSTEPWLFRIDESSSGKRRFKTPLSRFNVSKMFRTKNLNLLEFRIKEISKGYRHQIVPHWFNIPNPVISTDDDERALIAVIYSRLVVWKGGNKKGTSIETFDDDNSSKISDIIYHNKKFYVLYWNNRVVTVDPKSLNITEVIVPSSTVPQVIVPSFLFPASSDLLIGSRIHKFLVRSSNDLILITECLWSSENKVSIFKLDEEKRGLSRVKDPWEGALFVSVDYNYFFLSAKEFSGLKNNRAYVWDVGTDARVFNLEKLDGVGDWLSSFPEFFKIFWPLPTWGLPFFWHV